MLPNWGFSMWYSVEGKKGKADQIRHEVRKRMVYKHLMQRKFSSPKGYRPYEDVMLTIALNIELAEMGLDLAEHRWVWLCAIDIFGRAATDNIFPVYRVEPELLTMLLEAEEPKQFGKILPTPIESGLFLFPQGMVKVGARSIDWLLVDVVDQGDRSQSFKFEQGEVIFERLSELDRQRYRWVTQVESGDRAVAGDMFVSTFGYSETSESLENQYVSIGHSDIELTNVLTALSKHLWLWLYQPRNLEYVEATRSRGFGSKTNSSPVRYPIKLGIEEQPHKIYRPVIDTGDRLQESTQTPRKSPVKHVRRAHWRNVPIGLRSECKRELRLIPRSVVNPTNDY